MKRIYFVRHGRTGGNEQGLWQTFEQPLSDYGREQAAKVSKRFTNIKVDTVIASDMDRAFETAQIISADIGLEVIPTKLLHEIHRPEDVRGKSKTDEEIIKIMNEVEKNWGNKDWKHLDEENFFDLSDRVKKALDELLSLPADTIVAVTHEYVLRMVFAVIFFGDQLTPELFKVVVKRLWAENTGISEFTYDDGKWRMLTWNDHSHLLE